MRQQPMALKSPSLKEKTISALCHSFDNADNLINVSKHLNKNDANRDTDNLIYTQSDTETIDLINQDVHENLIEKVDKEIFLINKILCNN
jgi:hypothetical protein